MRNLFLAAITTTIDLAKGDYSPCRPKIKERKIRKGKGKGKFRERKIGKGKGKTKSGKGKIGERKIEKSIFRMFNRKKERSK